MPDSYSWKKVVLWSVVSVCCLVIVAGLVFSASTRTIRAAEPNKQNSPDANIESLRAENPVTTPAYEAQTVEEHQTSQKWIHPQTPPSSPPSAEHAEPVEPAQLTELKGRKRPRGQAVSGGELAKDQESPEIDDLAAIRELKRCKAALVAIMPPKTGSRHLHQILSESDRWAECQLLTRVCCRGGVSTDSRHARLHFL